MIQDIQRHLATIYDLPCTEDVRRFLIDEETYRGFTERHGLDPNAPEQLLLLPRPDDTFDVALYFRGDVLSNLECRPPDHSLNDSNSADFFIAVEGVSHFLMIDHRSRHDLECSALEMEVQAEIDKFITGFIYRSSQSPHEACGRELFEVIFENYRLRENLAGEEAERYRVASSIAKRFCHRLLKFHLEPKTDWHSVLKFLRLFYRQGWHGKYTTILGSDDAFRFQ